jgi:hypothetical protein
LHIEFVSGNLAELFTGSGSFFFFKVDSVGFSIKKATIPVNIDNFYFLKLKAFYCF